MRPRKKHNLAPRLAACEAITISEPESEKGRVRERFANPLLPLHVELGCGKGLFIRTLAARHPDCNFIAVEREPNVMVTAMEQALLTPLPNLYFILGDADRLPNIFEPGELSRGRLEMYKTLLEPDGEIWFKTDNYMLYHFSTFEFDACMDRYFSTDDLHHCEYAAGNIMTEYETYFSNLGQPIYSIRARLF